MSPHHLTPPSRLAARFATCQAERRAALVTYVLAGDPDRASSQALLSQLPAAGADIIELGMPFSDPMADGEAIQRAGQRALGDGQTLAGTLAMVREFRRQDTTTPLVLMGYLNPIQCYGETRFLGDAAAAVAAVADAVVVGSALVERLETQGQAAALALVRELAERTHRRDHSIE